MSVFKYDFMLSVVVNFVMWAWMWLRPTRVVRMKGLHIRGARALALPGFIFLTELGFNEATLRHEFHHIRQMKRYSPLGVALWLGVVYGYLFFDMWIRLKSCPKFFELYFMHPVEVAAFRAMERSDRIGPFTGEVPQYDIGSEVE